MSPTSRSDADAERFDVRSSDDTSIAVWADGDGPPLVLIHGGLNDHTTDRPFIDELRGTVTTFAIDRRGRGASGDGPKYAIEREFEDIAAVVDAVSARAGQAVSVWGHSYGADCAMGAAALTDNVARLILYERGLGYAGSDEVTAALATVDTAIAAGDLAGALFTALRGIVGLTEEEIAAVRATPGWPARLAAVPRLPREVRAEFEWSYQPGPVRRGQGADPSARWCGESSGAAGGDSAGRCRDPRRARPDPRRGQPHRASGRPGHGRGDRLRVRGVVSDGLQSQWAKLAGFIVGYQGHLDH